MYTYKYTYAGEYKEEQVDKVVWLSRLRRLIENDSIREITIIKGGN